METMNYLVSVYVFRYVIIIVEEEYGSSGAFPVMGFFFWIMIMKSIVCIFRMIVHKWGVLGYYSLN